MTRFAAARLLMNLRAHSVPGGISADTPHCRNNMWNCLECVHFIPEKEQLLYFEESAKACRKKAEIFKDYSIMEANFFRDCGSVPADRSENAERGTRSTVETDSKAGADETANN